MGKIKVKEGYRVEIKYGRKKGVVCKVMGFSGSFMVVELKNWKGGYSCGGIVKRGSGWYLDCDGAEITNKPLTDCSKF